MTVANKTPLIWPLLNRLNPTVAGQIRPKVSANQRLEHIPNIPWDDEDRPPTGPLTNRFDSDTRLWDLAPWQFGLSKLGIQAVRLQNFKTNPRNLPFSAQSKFPGVVRPLFLWKFFPPDPPPRDDRKTSRLIWPLMQKLFFNPKTIVRGSPINTNPRAVVGGVVLIQQNPKAPPQKIIPILPWDRADAPTEPAVVHQIFPYPPRISMISGVTRDNTGAILGNCVVELYETATNIALFQTISDPVTGVFLFTCAKYSPATHYIVAYKAGSPDVAGTTVNTLVGS